ncbi:MAG: leucine-rich repeat domain-containing protein [Clostridia bacterium]|nr:leucine-rich repeat domain-containing protein [Clostridia bacterium]
MLGCAISAIPADGSVTSIGARAFSGSISLKSIVIPENITMIGAYAFSNHGNLSKIVFNGTMEQWNQRRQIFDKDWDNGTGNYVVQCSDGTLDKDGREIQS